MRDTFLTKDTKAQVHKDVRPIFSDDCETYPLEKPEPGMEPAGLWEETEEVRGPRVVDTGKDVLGRPYEETYVEGEMRKTFSPAGDGGMVKPATFKPTK